MQLTEQHIVKTNEWRDWCVKAKELYNQTLYYWRQSIFGNIEYFSEYEILSLYRTYNDHVYRKLPSHCGQEVIKNLYENIKGWQQARKEYRVNPKKFSGPPRMPKFKKELSIFGLTNEQVKLKGGFIHFPKAIGVNPIKTKIPNNSKLGACRIIPKSNHFVIEIVYDVKEIDLKDNNGKVMGVDLGLNNLATCVTNNGNSCIINGKPLKSINQFYNKHKAGLQSKLKNNKHISNRIERLNLKRKNKVKNYLHHASKLIVDKALEYDISKIVIGNNKDWKQDINLGKRTNQNFVSIPHATLINQIRYKAKLQGIEVITIEESYTSKCSALDLESIHKHENYVGKRKKRGLFVTKDGKQINADCNGALNIIRKSKVVGEVEITDSIVSAVIAPVKLLPCKTHCNLITNVLINTNE